jgi:hypothetical protein
MGTSVTPTISSAAMSVEPKSGRKLPGSSISASLAGKYAG